MSNHEGYIVYFRAIDNFDKLSEEAASEILYEELVPACEAKGIKLSSYGNHAAPRSLQSVKIYNQLKSSRSLFDVKRVQEAYSSISVITQNTYQYRTESYRLKHVFEDHPSQNCSYLSNGDLIAAMLVKGHQANFGAETSEVSHVNCSFKVFVRRGDGEWF